MIVQYDYKDGMHKYIDAKNVSWKNIDVSDIVKKYSNTDKDNCNLYLDILSHIDSIFKNYSKNKFMFDIKNLYKTSKINVINVDNIVYLFNNDIKIYILNDNGKTLQKIA